jgi:hypothetical protein
MTPIALQRGPVARGEGRSSSGLASLCGMAMDSLLLIATDLQDKA